MTTTRRLHSIDVLRGLAALAVVAFHASALGPQRDTIDSTWFRVWAALVSHGDLGVPLFFVISGYCIHARAAHSGRTSPGLGFRAFWARRLRRLYPPYLVALTLSMGMVVAAWVLNLPIGMLTLYPEPKALWLAIDFGLHVTMLHGFFPSWDMTGGNPVYWSLAREEYLYLLYFPFLALRSRFGAGKAIAAIVLVGLSFALMTPVLFGTEDARWFALRSAIALWPQWILGALAVELVTRRVPRRAGLESGWTALPLAVLALASMHFLPPLTPLLWGLCFYVWLRSWVTLEVDGRWTESRVERWLGKVGRFSYSLYLVHFPVVLVGRQALGQVRETSNPYLFVVATLALAIASYFAAILFFRFVESRFIPATTSQ